MNFFFDHILTINCFLPLAGAIALMFLPKEKHKAIMYTATIILAVGFLVSLPLWFAFDNYKDNQTGMHFVEKAEWIKAINVHYYLGIDGISLLLILLTTLLGFISVLSSWKAITHRVKEYYIFMLLLQTGMLGVFMSLDFFLFYVFWEVMLVPMYFLIGVWGGPRKLYAAIKFFLYTLFGSVLMLLGILKLYFETGAQLGQNTFDAMEMYKLNLSGPTQTWVFLALFVAFAIKVPMFPFHTWLPDAHVEAPTAGSVILAGVQLKMGTYGFVRFSLPILPEATMELLPWMLILCVIGIIYGAMVAMAQKDVKKLVAYSSVSHLGFCMLGVFALNPPGLSGGILQMINHGLSTGALFLLVGLIYERRHTRMIADFGGISKSMPVYAVFFMVILLSSIGLPGLNGFIGEFTILLGAFHIDLFEASNRVAFFFKNQIWATLAVTGIILGAAYMLWLYQRVFFGKLDKPENEKLDDVKVFGREGWTLIPIVILCVWIGLYPKPFFGVLEEPVKKLVEKVQPEYFERWGEATDTDFGIGDKMPPVPKGHGSEHKEHGGGH